MFKQILTFVFLNALLYSEALEPVTTLIGIRTGLASAFWEAYNIFSCIGIRTGLASAFWEAYNIFSCITNECCNDMWLPFHLTALSHNLHSDLHGQHLVRDTVVKTLRGHLKEKSPKKALALSFHGWTGGGKSFVTGQIVNALFRKGYASKYVHFFVVPHHFPHNTQVHIYHDQLKSWIKGNVSSCARSLFIFDYMQLMPTGLVDVIKPFLEHYEQIDGVDYRKSMFIFLSNTAGESINEKALEHWRLGNQRESVLYKDLEEIIHQAAFNETGGSWHASLLKHNLISAFVPFLPLEKRHVKKCIKDDMKRKGYLIDQADVDKIADEMHYFPSDVKLFSKSGCKKVSEKLDFYFDD